jgi:pimeloyl-ACP methyl ester carboxylesterase
VVVPSIPGYGFSTPMRRGGVSAQTTAGLRVHLMRDVLGLGPFVTGGGDWGAVISIMMGHLLPNDLRGVYVTLPNFAPALRNRFEGFELDDLEPDERAWYEHEWRRDANIVHWSLQPVGGHFTACEQPELFVEDLRRFARLLRT